ncbi:hypothetical protein L873DRAFT_1848899 [Choiromyces venosus 120613-1]|uniref:Uncharacterized protein n=1 Tax=Choiromyces venosus 120613-1 TaxID=1336337 RepID=A0A3N4J1B6_9PEZI|nr:hypothetical protein L873DRAFT_1848899 [Choiromyces venosus 120613-1]
MASPATSTTLTTPVTLTTPPTSTIPINTGSPSLLDCPSTIITSHRTYQGLSNLYFSSSISQSMTMSDKLIIPIPIPISAHHPASEQVTAALSQPHSPLTYLSSLPFLPILVGDIAKMIDVKLIDFSGHLNESIDQFLCSFRLACRSEEKKGDLSTNSDSSSSEYKLYEQGWRTQVRLKKKDVLQKNHFVACSKNELPYDEESNHKGSSTGRYDQCGLWVYESQFDRFGEELRG